jgi:hypothetical protein
MSNPVQKKSTIIFFPHPPLGILQDLGLGALGESLLISFTSNLACQSFLLSEDDFQIYKSYIVLPQKLDLTHHLPKCSPDELVLRRYSWPNEDENSVGIEIVLPFLRMQICGHWEGTILQGACISLFPKIFSHDLGQYFEDLGYFNRDQLA